jgi:hypothetical protein
MRTSECDTELPLFEDSAHAPTLNATGRPHSYLLFLQEQIKGLIIVADVNAAIDAAVKEKIDNYQHDYNARNYFFLPAVMTTSGRENQWRLFPSGLHTVSSPISELFHTNGHPRLDTSTSPEIPTTPGYVLLLQSRHRPRWRPGHRHDDRHSGQGFSYKENWVLEECCWNIEKEVEQGSSEALCVGCYASHLTVV